jgi:hypothetical protein
MGDIQFAEDPQNIQQERMREKSFLTRLVLSTSIVSSERGAQYVLLVIAVLALVLAYLAPALLGGRSLLNSERVPRVLTAPGVYSPINAP